MRYLRAVIFSGLLLLQVPAQAQLARAAFQSLNSYQFFLGADRTDWGLQTINGIAYSQFFWGIGIGIDHYRYRSLPIFIDQRVFLNRKRNLFLYGDLGYNFPDHAHPESGVLAYKSYHFTGGVYGEGGGGLRIGVTRKLFFTLSAGFSYKELNDKLELFTGCQGGSCPVDQTTFHYSYGRWALKAGVGF